MSVITAITPQKKDKSRCNIEVDGRFYCGMKLVTVIENRLKVGSAVSEETLAAIQLESEKETALDKALSHITASMKTERDVRDFLQKKGYLPEVREEVVAKMREYGFLDDAAYAKAYAENAAKKKGKKLIGLELKRKGVSDETVEETLSALGGESETAKAVLAKYLRGKDVSDRAVIRRAYAHLLSKGFGYDDARQALREYADDED